MSKLIKENTDYTKTERILLSVAAFIIFGFIGAVFRVFYAPISLASLNEVALQFIPFIFGFAVIASVPAYFFPKIFSLILILIPTNWL